MDFHRYGLQALTWYDRYRYKTYAYDEFEVERADLELVASLDLHHGGMLVDRKSVV